LRPTGSRRRGKKSKKSQKDQLNRKKNKAFLKRSCHNWGAPLWGQEKKKWQQEAKMGVFEKERKGKWVPYNNN